MINFFDDIERYGKNTAVVTENGEKISYRALLETADGLAAHTAPRSLVFLVCENRFECIAAYIGFLRRRTVPVMISSKLDLAMLNLLTDAYKPNYIFTKSSEKYGSELAKTGGYALYKGQADEGLIANDDLAVLLTTSGSTGSPKLVRQSYANITANANSIAQYLKIVPTDRAITTMPMSYTYCLSIIQSHLLMGATVIATEATLLDKKFWELLKGEKATTFGGVPYTYEILKKLRFGRMELPSLRYITQAGGKLSPELSLEFATVCKEKGVEFIVMYGQTEATARMSYLPHEFAISKAGSMGIAIPGGRFSLRDADGTEITDAEKVGELVYKGENVTMGYAESRADLSRGDDNCGTLFTGDMAKRDADGFYYIVGRKKRFLKIFGNRVNLDEVEELLKKEGYACACIGRDDNMKIYCESNVEEEEIVDFVSKTTGLNRKAFSALHIDKIPRNEAGKILYAELEL